MRESDLDPIELLTPVEMAQADAMTIAGGVPGYSLMIRAGKNVASVAADMLRACERRRVVVYCGPGNNGGDGYVAARLLREQRFDVAAGALGDPLALRGDAAQAFADWGQLVVPAEDLDPRGFDLIIDALFGAGLSRALDGLALRIVERINASGAPVLAVDVPSGLDGAHGAIGSQCVRAAETVTFFRLKPGHLLMPGRDVCGKVRLTQIGIEDDVLREIASKTFLNAPGLWLGAMPWPGLSSHKYTRGHLVVASGPATRTGAGRLAARAGLRVGAGLVTLASPAEALAVNAAHLTAIMLRGVDGADQWRDLLADRRFSAVVIGPGFGVGEETRNCVAAILETAGTNQDRPFGLVLDADAVTSFAELSDNLASLVGGARVVLTPHEGEFARLFSEIDGNAHSKLDRARAAARALGACVLLKGPDTVVASPDGRACIARNAPPTLATAGSGDVLAGFVGGLLAQGMPAFYAASCAVWLHGEAANLFGPGLIAEDLPEVLPRVLADLASA
jgi:hydroxyethylthiazole kinase-like uncharacterized protein yjeF